MNRVSKFQSRCFSSCFHAGVVCLDNSLVLEIYSFMYERLVKKADFLCIDCLLLNSYDMNSGCFMLLREANLHCNMPDGRFNPHKSPRKSIYKSSRGSVQQSLSEI